MNGANDVLCRAEDMELHRSLSTWARLYDDENVSWRQVPGPALSDPETSP